MYPSIMFTVAITVSAFMLIKVVPVFAQICMTEWELHYQNQQQL